MPFSETILPMLRKTSILMQDPITTPDYQDKKRGQYTPDTDNKATQ
jgi:hypothetical protein